MSNYCKLGITDNNFRVKFDVNSMREDGIEGIAVMFGEWRAVPMFGGGFSMITAYLGLLLEDADTELYILDKESVYEIKEFLQTNCEFLESYFNENNLGVNTSAFIHRAFENIYKIEHKKDDEVMLLFETVMI